MSLGCQHHQPAPACRARSRWLRWLDPVFGFFYPPLCPGCDERWLLANHLEDPPPLCSACAGDLLPLDPPFCQTCGQAFDGPPEMVFRCANCSTRHLHFDFAIAPYRADGVLRELIHSFKFGRRSALRQPLGRLLAHGLDDPRFYGEDWLMVPVPIHRGRLRHRGFNQAHELARVASRATGLPVAHALRRIRATQPQSRLSREERLANLKGAIVPHPAAARALDGRAALLIDDVFTTGSTADICAQALLGAGARRVAILTLARG